MSKLQQLTLGISSGEDKQKHGKRKSPEGTTTSALILSAHIGSNTEIFPKIMALHVPEGATVADVTYGKGIFWKRIPPERYRLLPSDIKTSIDCHQLPYENESLDCVVLDPPYMERLFRRSGTEMAGSGNYSPFGTSILMGNLPTVRKTAPNTMKPLLISTYGQQKRRTASLDHKAFLL
jgi:hypothetical protein